MKMFTKLMSAMLAVMVFSALAFGQSTELDKFKLSQMDVNLPADVAFGVKPVPNQGGGSADISYATSNPSKDVLHDNGPFITHPTGGAGGNAASALQTGIGMGTYGSNVNHNASPGEFYYFADDFTVTATWTLTSMTFYGYQTGSSTTSTFNGVYVRIWDGDPALPASSVVWGDLTTNKFQSTAWTNVYRVLDTEMLNSQRPIMKIVANMAGCVLNAGTYWVQWGLTGTAASGPWGQPITILGQTTTGNAKQKTTAGATGWVALTDVGPQGLPFIIEGTTGAAATNDLGIVAITAPNSGVDLGSAEPVTITIQNFGTATQSNFPVSYTINAGAPVTETITSTIAGGATLSHTFATTANLSAYGSYVFEACVSLTGDENPANNCATKTVVNSEPSLCAPIYTSGCTFGDGLEDFILEQISNVASGCGNLNGTGWSQYFGLGPAQLTAGQTYNVTMKPGYDDTYVTIWIDFNDDLNLTPDEIVLSGFLLLDEGVSYTAQITIPANAGNGQHVMRARTNWLSPTVDPCGSLTYGEAEDYYVVVGGGIMLDPPTNLTAVVVDENDVLVNWDAPAGGGGTGEWIQWDNQTNSDGIGLTGGGTFWVASRWMPADLTPYDGMTLEKISFFPYEGVTTLNAVFELEVRTGAAGGTIVTSQPVATYTVNQWNEVMLTNPVVINATTDLWFGYKVIHGNAQFPAGVDSGPAIANKGDMISLDGTSFLSMSISYGLNFNWNIAGYVAETKGASVSQPMVKTAEPVITPAADASFALASENGQQSGQNVKFNPGNSKALLGYNVYRNGNMIAYTTGTTYFDEDLSSGTYTYYATAVYDDGESGPSNSQTVSITAIVGIIFCDDFESYTVGQQLVAQNSVDWTTWSGGVGTGEDPFIVTNTTKVVEITGTGAQADDIVYVIPNFTSGNYAIEFDIFIPAAKEAYFNVLHAFAGAASQWGMQVFFNANGTGSIDGDGATAATFNYPSDTWHNVEIMIDLDNDWAQFLLNSTLIHAWKWSEGTFGGSNLNQLGGVNFYSWSGATAQPLYHFDNFCFIELESIDPLLPPLNLVGVAMDTDAHLSWDAPGGGGGGTIEELIYDNNVNTGAYSYNGWTMGTRMTPAGACQILAMKLYTTGTTAFNATLFEWAGSQPSSTILYEQNVNAVDNAWMEVDVTGQNIFFTGEFVVGFGSINATTFLGYDGNLNNGRSWDYNNATQAWETWNEAYLIRAIVQYTDGTIAEIGPGGYAKPITVGPAANAAHPGIYNGVNTVKPIDKMVNPAKANLTGYGIYRSGVKIDEVGANVTNYVDPDLAPATYQYYVTAIYDVAPFESEPSNTVTIVIEAPSLPGPTNLTGPTSVNTGSNIPLTWDAPSLEDWLQWDNNLNNGNAIGLTGGGTFSVASRWMPDDLVGYNGYYLKKISFFPNDGGSTYVLKVWTGLNAGTMVLEQPVSNVIEGMWNEIELTTPVMINAGTDFWFGYTTTHGDGFFPAGCDDGPAIEFKGDMITTGGAWNSLHVLTGGSLSYNWNLAGYVTMFEGDVEAGEPILMEYVDNPVEANFAASGIVTEPVKMPLNASKDLLGYNVYRNNVMINTAIVPETNYTDVVTMSGVYNYYVTAVYTGNIESEPSNTWTVDVITSVTESGLSSTQIFPNPAKDMVNIQSDNTIHSVTVYNFTGQIVANENVNDNTYRFNSEDLKAGIYIFHINTSNGTVMERVVIQ